MRLPFTSEFGTALRLAGAIPANWEGWSYSDLVAKTESNIVDNDGPSPLSSFNNLGSLIPSAQLYVGRGAPSAGSASLPAGSKEGGICYAYGWADLAVR